MSNDFRKPFYKRVRFWFGLLMAPVIIGLFGWLLIWIDVQRQVAAARADSCPMSNEELEQYYQLPADCRDSTRLWFDAMQAVCTPYPFPFRDDLAQDLDDRFSVPCAGEPWENEQLSRDLLTGRHTALQQLADAAATAGAIRYPSEITEEGFWYTKQVGNARPDDAMALLHLDAAIASRRQSLASDPGH